MRIRLIALALAVAAATPALAQTPVPRAQVLAGEFSKFKNETRTKKGVAHTKYKEVVAEAWIAQPGAYAGRYFTDNPIDLEINIDANGHASGVGRDDDRFELRNLAINAGLLTGTRVYASGRSDKFEAVFLKRSTRASAAADFSVSYGIGMITDLPDHGVDGVRVFAQKQ